MGHVVLSRLRHLILGKHSLTVYAYMICIKTESIYLNSERESVKTIYCYMNPHLKKP